ncbi:MAG: fatty acid desaturase, partial [Cytophagales bacterium]
MVNQFRFSNSPEPHRIRTAKILKAHPEVKQLMGKNPLTLVAILGLVGGMVAMGYFLKDSPWWMVVLVAYLV